MTGTFEKKNTIITQMRRNSRENSHSSTVACFCHHLSDNYVNSSDLYVDPSDIYVDLSDHCVDLSEKNTHN